MIEKSNPPSILPALPTRRLGFHYFPDTLHYRQADLELWVPQLTSLGASWIVLQAPATRSIPEYFIRGVRQAGIEPILHFDLPLASRQAQEEVLTLFDSYAHWGVRYVVLFDCPNLRSAWPASAWTQAELVEQFLDRFLPLAERASIAGLTPVFPPLAPGGDYWDLAFLKAALLSMQRRGKQKLLENLVLSCEALAGNRILDWGAGGPESWPQSRPYYTPAGSQDQRGFYIFDWYLATAQAALGEPLPVLILKGGSLVGDQADPEQPAVSETDHITRTLALTQKILAEASPTSPEKSLPESVLACNFWLLAAQEGSPYSKQAWFRPDGSIPESRKSLVASLRETVKSQRTLGKSPSENGSGLIHHYLLLPLLEAGFEAWQIERLLPFIHTQHPTIGFSISEARFAERVTIAGGVQIFPEETVNQLRRAGCKVERILPDGTLIASYPLG